MKPIARLVPANQHKGISFQTYFINEEQQTKVKVAIYDEVVKAAQPFLQGHTKEDGWMMVEFWTDDNDKIMAAANHLAAAVGLELIIGEFTSQEVGVDPF